LPRGQCVQCTDNTQCPMGATCGTTGQTNGLCVLMCGTSAMCTTDPVGNDKCDATNNRCVDCMSDADCAVETTNKRCDTSVNPNNMLPRYACEECLDNSHCMANQVCADNECVPTCTTDAECSADGGGNAPHCNPTTRVCSECGTDAHCTGTQTVCINGECEDCTTDAHCMASQPMSPFCRVADNNCVACLTNDHCTPPQTCNTQGQCRGGGGGDGGNPMPDSGGGGG
jgi:hypothetical protein